MSGQLSSTTQADRPHPKAWFEKSFRYLRCWGKTNDENLIQDKEVPKRLSEQLHAVASKANCLLEEIRMDLEETRKEGAILEDIYLLPIYEEHA